MLFIPTPFNLKGRVTTVISGGIGTVLTIGSVWRLPENAFDGNSSQPQTSCAAANNNGIAPSGMNNFIGKDWGAGNKRRITKFVAISPIDSDFLGGGASNPTGWQLDGSNDGSSWATLDSGTTPGAGSSDTLIRTSTINTSIAYRFHRIGFSGNGVNGISICELQFYEDI